MPVTLQLFGAPAIDLGDGAPPVALPFERRSQLIVLLAAKRAWVGRAELAAILWPDQADKLAFTNLRKTLFRLQGLPWGAPLESQGSSLRAMVDTDVQAFEQALREQRTVDALALYRGALLAGFDDDAHETWTGWLQFERNRLQAAWRAAALQHLAADAVNAHERIALSARLLDADPLDEAALRLHLTLLAHNGQTARARQAWRDFVERLRDELGLAPGADLQALHDTLGNGPAERGTTLVPRAAADAAAGDAGFIGRAAERQRIAALLRRDERRLLTLTGPGGIGKTRLAQRVQQDLATAFADGVRFVRLEDVNHEGDLVARIARETGSALRGRTAALDQLCAALHERELLLVLDNFEQLAEGAASVLEPLLAACPRLKLLVTSRVRLGLAAEQLMPLEGLPCPEREDADRVESFDAARLFVAAAQRVEPALLPAGEATAIVDICRQVDGLPLALELAAAWTRVLSCEAIAAELREGTALLRADDASHPPRHASIEQVFDQSWQRLAPAEREALARLSVFHGGFNAEAARAVAGTPLPVLGALVDKSLLRRDGMRLALHPLVQQLAFMRLGDAAPAVRAAHAAYFHRLLAQLREGCAVGDRAALKTIDDEFENCRRAWDWAIAAGRADELRRSNATLQDYFDHRARFEEGLALLRHALASALCAEQPALHTLLLAWAAWLESRLARFEEAQADAVRARDASRHGHDHEARMQAFKVLGGNAWGRGRHADAKHWHRLALEEAEAGGFARERASLLENLALSEKGLGRYDEALQRSLEAMEQHRRNHDLPRLARCQSNLGSLYMFMHDDEAAATHLQQGLALAEQHGLVSTRAYVLANLTELAFKRGEHDAARAHAERALEVAQSAGIRLLAGWLQVQLARTALRRGELAQARELLSEGTALSLALGAPSVQAAALLALAELFEAQGHADLAHRVLAFASDEPTLSAPDRDELRVEWARRAASAGVNPGWPAISLDELLTRVVAERDLAHAPLIAALKA